MAQHWFVELSYNLDWSLTFDSIFNIFHPKVGSVQPTTVGRIAQNKWILDFDLAQKHMNQFNLDAVQNHEDNKRYFEA
ncbi:Protein of unknown function [Pyronema omphalodes CBS 100304]|uniref:Uncharacterized protein n=1 Tax=Pyronema omphalodes (strain CBS 100304) TaxID=1076935 RepID=U4L1W1_PYROM|nr:Protein of unknown function [Pyronema omphalodes CBS 100304]